MTDELDRPTRTARLANRWLLLISGAVTIALAAVLFATSGPSSLAAVAERCGQPAPDVRFTTSPDGVQDFLDRCGELGRSAYRDLQLADLVYPAAFGLFLASALAMLLPRVRPSASPRWRLLALVPLIGAAFDYLENLAAWTLLIRYPDPAPWAAATLGTASAMKQVANWASVLLLVVAIVGSLVAIVRRPRSKPVATLEHAGR